MSDKISSTDICIGDAGKIHIMFLFHVCDWVLLFNIWRGMLEQVGGHIADQMKNLEVMVLDGAQSFPIHFQFLKIGKR